MGRGVWISHTDAVSVVQQPATTDHPRRHTPLSKRATVTWCCLSILLSAAAILFARWLYYDLRVAYSPTFSVRPVSSEELNNVGVMEYESGHTQLAIAAYEQSVTVNQHSYTAMYNLGLVLQESGAIDEAISIFTRAASNGYVPAYLGRGYCLYQQGEYRRAIEDFDMAVKDWQLSQEADTYRGRGLAYYMLEEYDKALSDLEQAAHLNSSNPWNLISRGLGYMGKKRYTDARDDFKRALELNPNLAEAHYNLGLVRLYIGEKDKSLDDFKRAYELAEDDQLRNDAEAQLRNFGVRPGQATGTP
jgi:tetratricopeptide (TPR) repeat protein